MARSHPSLRVRPRRPGSLIYYVTPAATAEPPSHPPSHWQGLGGSPQTGFGGLGACHGLAQSVRASYIIEWTPGTAKATALNPLRWRRPRRVTVARPATETASPLAHRANASCISRRLSPSVSLNRSSSPAFSPIPHPHRDTLDSEAESVPLPP